MMLVVTIIAGIGSAVAAVIFAKARARRAQLRDDISASEVADRYAETEAMIADNRRSIEDLLADTRR